LAASRFLYVDVSALRAKQLRRGAKARLTPVSEEMPKPVKPERVAMEEVREGLVEWALPDFKAVFDVR
jgi:DNA-directed RNA polymerase subunit K/omega